MPVDLLPQLLEHHPAAPLGVAPVDDDRQRVHPLAVHEDVHADQVRGPVADHLVVHRPVPVGDGLELVVQVVDDLRERHLVGEDHPLRAEVLHPHERAPAVGAHLHQVADVRRRDQEADLDDRLAELLDLPGVRHVLRVVDLEDFAPAGHDLVGDVRGGLH